MLKSLGRHHPMPGYVTGAVPRARDARHCPPTAPTALARGPLSSPLAQSRPAPALVPLPSRSRPRPAPAPAPSPTPLPPVLPRRSRPSRPRCRLSRPAPPSVFPSPRVPRPPPCPMPAGHEVSDPARVDRCVWEGREEGQGW